MSDDNLTYIDRFEVEQFSKEIQKFIDNKNFTTIISRIQTYNSVMCRYFCFGFINFMLKRKSLLNSSILYGGVRTFWIQKIRQEKLTKFINIFELYQVFMYNVYDLHIMYIMYIMYMCNIMYIYILFIKRINTFWFEGITTLQHSGKKSGRIHKAF